MNGFDYTALAVLGAAIMRGYKRGLSVEFYQLFRMAVALLAGTSLYGMLSDALTGILNIKSGIADPAMFLGSTVVVWSLLRRMRAWMEAWILAKLPKGYQSIGGAVAAGLKTSILLGGVVVLFNLADWLPGHTAISRDSITSEVVHFFLPDN